MKSQEQFVVGKHNIGYVSSDFEKRFKDIEFSEKKTVPTFQKLPRTMTDIEIEYELKPGYCELGDVIAFMDSAPKECKDGYPNIFYTSTFVVRVGFNFGGWYVRAYGRGGGGGRWRDGRRVFSPASETSTLNTPDTVTLLSLSARIEKIEKLFNKELLFSNEK